MFKRKAYDMLLNWKRTSNGRTAALIEGARRVGKSTVARAFAEAEYEDYLLLDFSEEGTDVKELFARGLSDLDSFFRDLFLLKGKSLAAGCSVVIFDEVQLFPRARQAIKQLVADGRYHYIETGSLISIRQNVTNILIPSEEYRIRMYPMDFEEFLCARGDNVTGGAIRDSFSRCAPMGGAVHRRVLRLLREYMAVGGMPQVVADYVEGATYEQIDFAKRSILGLYEEDLHKYDSEEHGRVSALFRSIPKQLGNQSMKFKFSEVEKGARYDRLVSSIEFLKESMTVNICENVTVPDPLVDLYVDQSNFKAFMGDTGLLVTAASAGFGDAPDALYRALVFGKLGSNLGMVMENMVAQMLVASGHELRFHEFEYQSRDAGRPARYEIDFLLTSGRKMRVVEVKSSSYKTHASFDHFFEKYAVKAGGKYVLYGKDLAREGEIVYAPWYMAMCL